MPLYDTHIDPARDEQVRLTLKLPKDLLEKMRAKADREGESLSSYVRRMFRRHVERTAG